MAGTAHKFRCPEHLHAVESYVPGLLIPEVASRYGIPEEKIVKLASAENPLGTSPKALEAMGRVLNDLHLYPDWRAQRLREAIAEHYGIRSEQTIIGAGETELIPLIIQAFSQQGDQILFPIPTFPIYGQVAAVERRDPVFVHMGEALILDPERLLQAVTDRTRIVILTSPNNPLSRIIDREILDFVLGEIPADVLVLLDEAYVDYSTHGSQMDLLSQHENLIVLRTFSKVYGLAGLRVGYGMAHEKIIEALMKMKPTWNIGLLASTGALAALQDREHYDKTRSMVLENRDYLVEQLSRFSNISTLMTPQANFLCLGIQAPSLTSTDLFEGLLQRGIIIKDCSVSYKGLGDRYVRVDVSLRPKLDRFLEGLEEVFS